jgi:hypothetical protein
MTHLALGELGLDLGPGLRLGSVGEEVHDNGGLANGLVNVEQVLAGNPAVLLSLLPRLAVLPYTDDDVQAVVAHVETLAVALGAIADEGQRVVLEVLLARLLAKLSLKPFLMPLRRWSTYKKLLLWPVGTLCLLSSALVQLQLTSSILRK